MDCAGRAIGLIWTTGWLCVFVVGVTRATGEMEGDGSWGQGPAKLKWAIRSEAETRALGGKRTLGLRMRLKRLCPWR